MNIAYTVWTWMQSEFGRGDNPSDQAEAKIGRAHV